MLGRLADGTSLVVLPPWQWHVHLPCDRVRSLLTGHRVSRPDGYRVKARQVQRQGQEGERSRAADRWIPNRYSVKARRVQLPRPDRYSPYALGDDEP